MLGLDNPIHILFLLVIVLLVFGAKRLPEMGKSLGEGLRGFKESVSGESHETATPEMTALQSTPAPVPATGTDTWIAPDITTIHETETERVPARPAA
jgi:sec-independent protein translocase protein TatA